MISGRSVTFRKTGGTALRYKRQFGRELFADLGKMVDLYADFQKIEQFIIGDGQAGRVDGDRFFV